MQAAPALVAIGQNIKGCDLRYEGRKSWVRPEVSIMLLMGVLKGSWPFETAKLSSAETLLNLVFPHAWIPPAPHKQHSFICNPGWFLLPCWCVHCACTSGYQYSSATGGKLISLCQ